MQKWSLRELETAARLRLDAAVYDYFAGGADDEITLRENETAFARLRLVPHVLRGPVGTSDVTLLGSRASMPVIVAPTAFHRLAHDDGELATARAVAAAGTIMVVSMAATVAVEELAASGATLWFQLFVQPDRGFTEGLVRRAEAAGCGALVVSVDAPVFGRRERDLRNGFHELPDGMRCEHMDGRSIAFSALSWDDVEWLRTVTTLPIALKGIVHPEDARLAVRRGVDAIIVSNHGGRQLDTMPASIDLLPSVVDAVDGAVPVLMDGGVRRGTDVVKALALGASAVGIGRLVVWGLATAGEAGVLRVLELLRAELESALALCGSVDRDLVRR
jgi:4-hydroxymandelate oxidase